MKTHARHVLRMACGGAMAILLLMSGGCFRDPNVRKQEYVKAGERRRSIQLIWTRK